MTTVFLTGATSDDDQDASAFEVGAARLTEAGFQVVSPYDFQDEPDLRRSLERNVDAVLEADGVALLDGWERSPGAVVDTLTASSQGKPARRVKEWLAAAVAGLALVLGVGGTVPATSADLDPVDRVMAARAHRLHVEERIVEKRLEKVSDRRETPRKERKEGRLRHRLQEIRHTLRAD